MTTIDETPRATLQEESTDTNRTINKSSKNNDQGNTEEITYVDIHETHVIKAIEKKLGTNHFVLLNYELIPLTEKLGLLGDHRTLVVTFLNDIGTKQHLHFFVKYFPWQESPAVFAEGIGAFKKEIFVYKLFKEFIKENVNIISCVVPKFHVVAPDKYFILDDLAIEGYKGVNKHNNLDYDSVLIVLQALAKLHASSFIFEQKVGRCLLDLYSTDLEESFFNGKEDFANLKGVESCIKCVLEEIELFGFPKKLKSGKSFVEVAEKVCNKIYDVVKPSEKFKNVLNHGDIWATNILLKYDDKTKKPISCKLVDFQCGRYAPPAQDVLAFLHLTTSRDFRKQYMYEVVGMYYNYLEKNLKQSGLKIDEILTFTDFLESCEKQKLFAVIQAAFYFPLILINNDDIGVYFSDPELNQKILFENRMHLVLAHKDKDQFYQERLKESIEDLKDICEVSG